MDAVCSKNKIENTDFILRILLFTLDCDLLTFGCLSYVTLNMIFWAYCKNSWCMGVNISLISCKIVQ